MPYFKSNKNSNEEVNIYYESLGSGKPIIFIHGWPLNGNMWEYQITELTQKGYHCITYDRRGFGRSDRPLTGYDYHTLAADLKALIAHLKLTDITLVAFSMGGGEAAKYFADFGGENISKLVLVSCVTPYMLKTEDNPNGVPQEQIEQMAEGIKNDRPAFLEDFAKNFYGVSMLNNPVSDAFLANNLTNASEQLANIDPGMREIFCLYRFPQRLGQDTGPNPIIHGDADKIVPMEATSRQSANRIANSQFIVYDGAPHGLWYTERAKLNEDLMKFIG